MGRTSFHKHILLKRCLFSKYDSEWQDSELGVDKRASGLDPSVLVFSYWNREQFKGRRRNTGLEFWGFFGP